MPVCILKPRSFNVMLWNDSLTSHFYAYYNFGDFTSLRTNKSMIRKIALFPSLYFIHSRSGPVKKSQIYRSVSKIRIRLKNNCTMGTKSSFENVELKSNWSHQKLLITFLDQFLLKIFEDSWSFYKAFEGSLRLYKAL